LYSYLRAVWRIRCRFFWVSHGDGTQALPLFFDLLDGDSDGSLVGDYGFEPKLDTFAAPDFMVGDSVELSVGVGLGDSPFPALGDLDPPLLDGGSAGFIVGDSLVGPGFDSVGVGLGDSPFPALGDLDPLFVGLLDGDSAGFIVGDSLVEAGFDSVGVGLGDLPFSALGDLDPLSLSAFLHFLLFKDFVELGLGDSEGGFVFVGLGSKHGSSVEFSEPADPGPTPSVYSVLLSSLR